MNSTFHAMTTFGKHEVDALFKATIVRYKFEGLEIRLAPKFLPSGRLLVVTPRACGNAPQRNRIRRRIKSIFYENALYQAPFDWIFLIRKECINRDFGALKDHINQALTQTLTKFPQYNTKSHEAA